MRVLIALAAIGLHACDAPPEGPAVQQAEEEVSVTTIDAEALAAKVEAGEVTLVDVRTAEEFAEGHLAGAVNMPVDSLDPAALDGVVGETILYCRSGRRSERAAKMLSAHRGDTVTHLEGGILAWEEAGQPVVSE